MNASFPSRVKIISGFIVFIGLLIVAKLFFLQIIHNNDFLEQADRQYFSPSGNSFDRGSIFMTKYDGTEVTAASVMVGYILAIVPEKVNDVEDYYNKLNSIVPIDKDEFTTKSLRKSDPYEEVADHLTKEQADSVKALVLSGVNIYKEKWRVYPGNNLASRTIGFISYKGDDLLGRYGLERSYNDVLSRSHESTSVNFFAELFSNLEHTVFNSKVGQGDIVTTIDPEIEQALEYELRGVSDKWHSDLTGGIVMNPKTGEIYAMNALPDFNVNEFSKVTDPSLYGNPLVENVYELGSIIKTLTMSAGINEGLVTPDTKYDDKGFVIIGTEKINNFDKKARGVTTMQEVLNQSLNTGATFVEQKLGKDKFRDYFLNFEVNKKSGVDLPGEVNNLVSNLKSTREIEYATAAFGQGIALTPISAIRSFTAVANHGVMVTPHLVKKIRFTDGSETILEYPTTTTMLKESTTETMAKMMTTIVDTALLSGSEKIEHYSVAAKTGTAQIARADGKGYYEDQYLHSVYGFYPAYNPEFIVLMYTVNPKGINYSANTLGRPFMSLARFLLAYHDVPPDR